MSEVITVMPTAQIGEIRYASDIGKEITRKRGKGHKYIWLSCPDCGQSRWVQLRNNIAQHWRCFRCARINVSREIRGDNFSINQVGRIKNNHGYILKYVGAKNFYSPMADSKGYIPEHRLIMAQSLRRLLHPWELVHHRNSVRYDNRLENLLLLVKGRHNGKIKCPFCHKEFGLL